MDFQLQKLKGNPKYSSQRKEIQKVQKLKGDRVISPAVRAKNTTNGGRNDAVTL